MDWSKGLGYISNITTVLCISGVVVVIILKVPPDTEWAGVVIGAAIGGLVGYLKGISTK